MLALIGRKVWIMRTVCCSEYLWLNSKEQQWRNGRSPCYGKRHAYSCKELSKQIARARCFPSGQPSHWNYWPEVHWHEFILHYWQTRESLITSWPFLVTE